MYLLEFLFKKWEVIYLYKRQSYRLMKMPKNHAIIGIILLLIIIGTLLFAETIPESIMQNFEGDQRIEAVFGESDCSLIQVPALNDSYYKGPMIDTHIHIAAIPDGPVFGQPNENDHPLMGVNLRMGDYVCMMDQENTSKVFAFFPVWDPIITDSLAIVNQTLGKYPGRFVPFIMPPDSDNSPGGYPTVKAGALEEMLSVYPGMFQGYGEIGLYARQGGAAELPPDSERLTDIYPVVRRNNLIVYVHLGEGQKKSFERVLEANPDINFIWHGDQLIAGSAERQNLSEIEDILYKHSNAYYGVDELYGDTWLLRPQVSKQQFLQHFNNPELLLAQDVATWKGFIERHPDQVLWGTDRGWSAPWSLDEDVAVTLNTYTRAFIARLDISVQEKFAYGNAQKLIE